MKKSTMTVEDAVGLLPRTLRQRYSGGGFSWKVTNQIFSEFEKELEAHFFFGEVGLLLVDGKTDYALDSSIRQIRGAYARLESGDVIPYRQNPISFTEMGQFIRLHKEPDISDEDDISGTVSDTSADLDELVDSTAGKLDDTVFDDNELAGRLLRLTHADATVEWKMLRGNDVSETKVTLNGLLNAAAAAGDTYLITDNFYMLEVVKYITRVTAESDTLDIPQDWETAFIAYLHWKYELQADEQSNNTRIWYGEARRQLYLIKADSRHRGDTPKKQGRRMPTFFS